MLPDSQWSSQPVIDDIIAPRDKAKINAEKLVEYVNHPNKIF